MLKRKNCPQCKRKLTDRDLELFWQLRDVDGFLWSLRAQEILWPALNSNQRWECMESFMEGFQR